MHQRQTHQVVREVTTTAAYLALLILFHFGEYTLAGQVTYCVIVSVALLVDVYWMSKGGPK